jgi:hypothetical protein
LRCIGHLDYRQRGLLRGWESFVAFIILLLKSSPRPSTSPILVSVGFGYRHADSFLSLFGSICFLSLLTDSAIDDPEIAVNEPTILLMEVDVKRADNINQRL